MSSIGRNLLLKLHVKRRALLRRYDDDNLHQLRVALRRLRSLLRYAATDEAQTLRHALGQLAQATNAARDWDTLQVRARDSLSTEDFRLLQPYLESHRAASQGLVLAMLRSAQWAQAVRGLEDFIGRGGLQPAGDRAAGNEIDRARQGVRRAWLKVQSRGEAKHWHKLRLAIKELRYTFDSLPRNALAAPMKRTLKHCKHMQDLLGAWHDTVIHLERMQELAEQLDRVAESESHEVLKVWRKQLQRERRATLSDARRFLAGKGACLLDC